MLFITNREKHMVIIYIFPVKEKNEVLLDDAQSAAIIANACLLATLTGIIPLNPNVSWVERVS